MIGSFTRAASRYRVIFIALLCYAMALTPVLSHTLHSYGMVKDPISGQTLNLCSGAKAPVGTDEGQAALTELCAQACMAFAQSMPLPHHFVVHSVLWPQTMSSNGVTLVQTQPKGDLTGWLYTRAPRGPPDLL